MQQPNNENRHNFQPTNGKMELPINNPCQIYPRTSTPNQKEEISAEMQRDKLFALSCGWREDLILLDTRDLGVSGQSCMEDRLAFHDMLRCITSGEIKAVVIGQVDRLFQNEGGRESGTLLDICQKYGVFLVTPDFTCDLRMSWHKDHLQRQDEEVWNVLKCHVSRLHAAQNRRGYAGYWTGGKLPMGYILDTRKIVDGQENPNFYRYIVYEPHAEVIRWIFRKFKE